jgi:predicted FMN-binding regulatory protein PaiB
MYRGNLGRIAAVRLAVRGRRVKFKLGQNRPPEVRARVAQALRERGRAKDRLAADALEWTLQRRDER